MILTAIVPALNEADHIQACVEALAAEADEVLVVDGGSRDATRETAIDAGAGVVSAPRGLASQCNAGATRARGDVLLFLAADSLVPQGFRQAIEETLASPYVAAGGFRLAIRDERFAYRVIEFGGNFRARFVGMALPDQGLFVRRSAYEALGGMRRDSLIPFARLCFDLRSQGEFRLARRRVLTSPRKWYQHGKLATTWSHVTTYVRFRRELPPHW